jgi:hypothetical protein
MISECLNPACRRQLHYLRNGKVIRIVHPVEDQVSVEHFWLCGDCNQIYDFKVSPNGAVSLCRRAEPVMPEPTPPPVAPVKAGILTMVA